MATAPPEARHGLRCDLRLATETVRAGVVPSRDARAQKMWTRWCSFCTDINADPLLSSVADPIPFLQTFGVRFRDGRLAPSHNKTRARTVEDAIRLVCQRFSELGAPDPRLDAQGHQDFRLRRMYAAWKKEDDPPARVEPIPMPILLQAEALGRRTPRDRATLDCMWMGFYFLLRPGEYANASGDAKTPFRLQDVQFKIGSRHYPDVMTVPIETLLAATFVSLTFTNQKNGVKGEKLGHASNGQRFACPVRAVIRRVEHLRSHHAHPSTPLHVYYDHGAPYAVSASMLSSLLRSAALTIPGHCGVQLSHISARSLRNSGAMALLLAGCDPDKIRIVGRWRSDAMFRYMHSHALPLIQNNSTLMFRGGSYHLA